MDAGPDWGRDEGSIDVKRRNTVAEASPTARRATKRRSSPNDGSRENAGDDFLSLFDAHRFADGDSPSAQFIPGFLSIAWHRTNKSNTGTVS
jgi:hypothetical protein